MYWSFFYICARPLYTDVLDQLTQMFWSTYPLTRPLYLINLLCTWILTSLYTRNRPYWAKVTGSVYTFTSPHVLKNFAHVPNNFTHGLDYFMHVPDHFSHVPDHFAQVLNHSTHVINQLVHVPDHFSHGLDHFVTYAEPLYTWTEPPST